MSQNRSSAHRTPTLAHVKHMWVGTLLLWIAACVPDAASRGDAPSLSSAATVVDSIFPIEEELRRFRAGLPEVTALAGGASSRDELVDLFVRAVEAADTLALAPLLLTRAEFAYLHYPHTIYTAPPYELSPALLWFQMENLTSRSLTRLFQRLAGAPLHVTGYRCEDEPTIEGPNRVWSECRLLLAPPDAEPLDTRLFGSILERDGVFKFVSYSSEL